MKIKKVKIINFEGYKDATLHFSKGINSIRGKNDQGKSAIVRAIQWVITNRPLKNTYKPKYWGKPKDPTIVIIETWDDHIISRKKSSICNEYILDGEKLTGFGTEVPEQIQRVLNMNEINCQLQLDPHFLLLESHGEISRYLNKIVNFDIIDATQARADKEKKTVDNKIIALQKNEKHLKETLEKFQNFNEIECLVESAETIHSKIEEKEEIKDIIIDLSERKKEFELLIESNENILQNKIVILKAEGIRKTISYVSYNIEHIEKLINNKSNISKKIEKINKILKQKKNIEKIELCKEKVEQVQNTITRFSKLQKCKDLLIIQIKENQENIIEYRQCYKDSFPGGICPLCDSIVVKGK